MGFQYRSGETGREACPTNGESTRTGQEACPTDGEGTRQHSDRKSTRLNSSHRCISDAVFCLKKNEMPSMRLDDLPRPGSVGCPLSLWSPCKGRQDAFQYSTG